MTTDLLSPDLIARLSAMKQEWHELYSKIGAESTPEYDGAGRQVVKKRPDGKDYIEEAYMRKMLDKHFPGWSWEAAAPLHFLGAEWVVAQGHLCIVDEHLLAFGIVPPVRKFYGVDSVRIQYGKDKPHTPDNIVDVGDNCKSAASAALKYAINRLCNIGDDVYGKRIEEEGSGSGEEIIYASTDTSMQQKMVLAYWSKKGIRVSKAFATLGITAWSEVQDWAKAYDTLKNIYH